MRTLPRCEGEQRLNRGAKASRALFFLMQSLLRNGFRKRRRRGDDERKDDDAFFCKCSPALACSFSLFPLYSREQRRPRTHHSARKRSRTRRETRSKRGRTPGGETEGGTTFGRTNRINASKQKKLTVAGLPLARDQRLPPRGLLGLVDRRVHLDADDGLAELVLAHLDGAHGVES